MQGGVELPGRSTPAGSPLVRARTLLREIERRKARNSLAVYCGLQQPTTVERDEDLVGLEKLPMAARYVPAQHHRLMIDKLEGLERGWIVEDQPVKLDRLYKPGEKIPLKRLMISMPPGSAKSTYGSVLFPAWYLGKNPRKCLLQGSYNKIMAKRFGRRARNTFGSREHFDIFGVGLGKSGEEEWETSLGGEYLAFGMESGVTSRRADGIVIDDPVKGRADADSETIRDRTWETYRTDLRSRMKPGAWILYIATRWHEDDPAGRILGEDCIGKSGWFQAKDGEWWYVISLNAVIESEEEARNDILGRKVGEILWPEWFTEGMLLQERRTQGLRNWFALYKQMPRPDEGGILKRIWWRRWGGSKPPKCEYVVSVYDTAFEEGEEDDFSARTTWGIFWYEDTKIPEPPKEEPAKFGIPRLDRWKRPPPPVGRHCAILLEAWEEKVDFPELRRIAREHYRKYKPDVVLVEKKASGHSLIQELRKGQIPVRALKADISKLARAHSAAPVLEDGCIFTMDFERWPEFLWARHVIERCASFPTGRYNDIGDTCVHAFRFLRDRFHLTTKGDQPDEDDNERERYEPQRKRGLFG